MTVRELCERMDSAELSEWMAFTRYFFALPNPWLETGLIASSLAAPYCQPGEVPKPGDFVPLERPPQAPEQDREALLKLRKNLGIED
jgi:hypothetical protein